MGTDFLRHGSELAMASGRRRGAFPGVRGLGGSVSRRRVVFLSAAVSEWRTSRSRWVQEEILMFRRLHGGDNVFAFIVAGEPKGKFCIKVKDSTSGDVGWIDPGIENADDM